MASLASLPQELVDMILDDLKPADLGKVRQLSRDHNARFQGLFWHLVFHPLKINLSTACIERLIRLEGCPVTSQIQSLAVFPHFSEDLKISRTTSLLTKAFASLSNLKFVMINVHRHASGFDFWKPVMDAIIKSKRTTVEYIQGPGCGIQMSKFKFSPNQIKGYTTTFTNLKSLDIKASVQVERAHISEEFWSFIEKIGTNLENLTVSTGRTAETISTPNSHGGYLPQNFNLPKLKELKLCDVSVTPMDLKKLLRNADLEAIDISRCRMADPKKNWFEVVKFLRDNRLEKVKKLELMLSAYYVCHGGDSYDLPNLTINGECSWTSEGNNCRVMLRSGLLNHYVAHKNLWDELGKHDGIDNFWASLTNNKWTSKRATRWKRLETANIIYRSEVEEHRYAGHGDYGDDTHQEIEDEYERKVMDINAEVDSECEGIE
ncbi:hypothetical protein TWF730_009809 [Orbilia blumenaviensis]|uniref:F-box domain-containing protein n=1 Tax=Orbilia blumenaviensis TaxID=1796055 RepID=A0AAV9UW29_9PEZI